jgi:hypothetical protein
MIVYAQPCAYYEKVELKILSFAEARMDIFLNGRQSALKEIELKATGLSMF